MIMIIKEAKTFYSSMSRANKYMDLYIIFYDFFYNWGTQNRKFVSYNSKAISSASGKSYAFVCRNLHSPLAFLPISKETVQSLGTKQNDSSKATLSKKPRFPAITR